MSVEVDDVKLVIGTETQMSDEDITSFITLATTLVSETVTETTLSANRLDLITRYLAAHLIAVSDDELRAASKKIGNTQYNFNELLGMGLKSTRYGQMALLLDTSGSLSSISPVQASLKALPVIE